MVRSLLVACALLAACRKVPGAPKKTTAPGVTQGQVRCPLRFKFDAKGTRYLSVFVAGEFNNWRKDELRLADPNGDLIYEGEFDLPTLAPGRYAYKLVVSRGGGPEWILDPGNTRIKVVGGMQNSLFELSDCRIPTLNLLDSQYDATADQATIAFAINAPDPDGFDPATLNAETSTHQSVPVTLDADGKSAKATLKGDAPKSACGSAAAVSMGLRNRCTRQCGRARTTSSSRTHCSISLSPTASTTATWATTSRQTACRMTRVRTGSAAILPASHRRSKRATSKSLVWGRVDQTFVQAHTDAYGKSARMSSLIDNHGVPRFITHADNKVNNYSQMDDTSSDKAKESGWDEHKRPLQPTQLAACRLAQIAYGFAISQPPIPLIYYGNEIGLPGAGDPDNRRMMPWNDYNPGEQELLARYKRFGALRAPHPALRSPALEISGLVDPATGANDDTLAFFKTSMAEEILVLIDRRIDGGSDALPV